MNNIRKRGWCITAYENDWEGTKKLLDTADYSIIGNETCPKTGRKHLQCYGYWNNKISFNEIKRWTNANIQAANGSAKQNFDYCSKEGNYTTKGQLPSQGARTDIAEFRDYILSGASETDCIMEYPNMMAKYDRFYQRCRNIVLKEEAKKMIQPEVIVIQGEPGVGKTHTIYAENEIDDIYKIEVGDGSSGSVFWDGYNGEKVIVIDDFHNNLKLDYMLRLLDKYPMKLNIKGGYTWKCAKKIYITTNINIDKWYSNCQDIHRRALRRRITKIWTLDSDQRIHNNTLIELETEQRL